MFDKVPHPPTDLQICAYEAKFLGGHKPKPTPDQIAKHFGFRDHAHMEEVRFDLMAEAQRNIEVEECLISVTADRDAKIEEVKRLQCVIADRDAKIKELADSLGTLSWAVVKWTPARVAVMILSSVNDTTK